MKKLPCLLNFNGRTVTFSVKCDECGDFVNAIDGENLLSGVEECLGFDVPLNACVVVGGKTVVSSEKVIVGDGFCIAHFLGRLNGGKGGFGSLLRGQKGGGKRKTTNMDACRDLNGRRIRHARSLERLKQWMETKKNEEELLSALGGESEGAPVTREAPRLDDSFVREMNMNAAQLEQTVERGMIEADKRGRELEQLAGGSRRRPQLSSASTDVLPELQGQDDSEDDDDDDDDDDQSANSRGCIHFLK
eukprot:CAMPEP_0113845186 /NCGR_PEP_ID=MMETSP0372-20130328/621_1 /TAXON_ID=340204 /ORGANISM="Lankesteria abbotti" /LENGTH=247 /DNA_ID=CAMNT_0000814209 /DNA_START=17 /DNA_END=760 /DNA_ORIENTATION=- /assembly_acc=CAM_ASM_000359